MIHLEPGPGTPRTLAGGTVHEYRFDLVAGELLHVELEQMGFDIAVEVSASGGNVLFEVDSPSGGDGVEPVYLVTDTHSSYSARVRLLDEVPQGRYRPRIVARRPAGVVDRQRARAEATYWQARKTGKGGKKALPRAKTEYLAAGDGFESLGDVKRQAEALSDLGDLCFRLRDYEAAVEFHQRSLSPVRATGDLARQALTLQQIGDGQLELGRLDEAQMPLWQSVVLSRALSDRNTEAAALASLGQLHQARGELSKARTLLADAYELWRGIDELSAAATLTDRAAIYIALGEGHLALSDLKQAFDLLKGDDDARQRAITLTRTGEAFLALGAPHRALFFLELALARRRTAKDSSGEAVTLSAMGRAYYRLKEYRRALDAYRRAVAIFGEIGDPGGQAIAWSNLGWVHSALRQPALALDSYDEALRLAEGHEMPAGKAAILFGMAYAERLRGNLITAQDRVEDALAAVESLRDGSELYDLKASLLAAKEDYYGFLIDLLMEQHRLQPAKALDAEALAVSERARARSLHDAVIQSRSPEGAITDPAGTAFGARIPGEIDSRVRALRRVGPVATPESRKLQRELEALLEQWGTSAAGGGTQAGRTVSQPHTASLVEIQRLLDDDTVLLEYYLGEPRSFLWAVTRTSVVSFELPGRSVLGASARKLHKLLASSYLPLHRDSAAREATALSRVLLGQVAGGLTDERLLIVPHDALHYIPFSALPHPAADAPGRPGSWPLPLVARHEVVQLPSASVLAQLRERQTERPPPPGLLAILADPVFGRDDPRLAALGLTVDLASAQVPGEADPQRLPYSAEEAESILALAAGRGEVLRLSGFEASRAAVLGGGLGRFRIVHFATHGTLATTHPERSMLELSRFDAAGRRREGRVWAREVYGLDLPAELVVLSACETALGEEIRGEGLVGLSHAFLTAGSARVVVSLWSVNDHSTSSLMEHFYRYLLVERLPPGAALRAAQTAMWQEPSSQAPYHWAGFVLQGDWRPISIASPSAPR